MRCYMKLLWLSVYRNYNIYGSMLHHYENIYICEPIHVSLFIYTWVKQRCVSYAVTVTLFRVYVNFIGSYPVELGQELTSVLIPEHMQIYHHLLD